MAIQIRRGTNAQWEAQNGNIVEGEPAIATDTGRFFVGTGTGTYKEFPSVDKVVDMIYPVGSIYMSVNSADPSTLFGGTWEQIEDTFLLSAGSTYTAGDTGGEAEHTLTTGEMPTHRHSHYAHYQWHSGSTNTLQANGSVVNVSSSSGYAHIDTDQVATQSTYVGNGESHNNMPPYLVVYVWKRTA